LKKSLTALALAAATVLTTAGSATAAPSYDIVPGALPRGANVQIPHIEGHSVVDGSIRIKVAAARVDLLGKAGSNYVISTHNADYGDARVWKLQPDGSRSLLLRGRYADNVVLSDQGATLVSATNVGNRTTRLLAIDVASGDSAGSRKFHGYVSALDVDGPRVALGSWSQTRAFIWNFRAHTTRTLVDRVGYFADLSSDQFAFYTKDPYNGGCSVLTHVSRPADRIWRSCGERIEAMNPDGTRVAAIHILSDGMGPGRVVVHTATGGRLATYDVAGYFGLIRFEDKFDLLLDSTGKKYAAMVRCDLGGCERASNLRDAQF
jgi:hypothetical protein